MQIDYTIIGAGISGLTAALTLKSVQPDANIIVLDAASEPGGLLRSVSFDDKEALRFDLGTHIPELTENQKLNELIFPSRLIGNWEKLNELKVGNFFNGHLNQLSPFPKITQSDFIFNKILVEVLKTEPSEMTGFSNLEDLLIARYGWTLTKEMFEPLIKKITAADLKELTPQTINYYGLVRVILGDHQIALNLKKIPHLDQVLAFVKDSEKPRKSTWVYPGEQGVGEWVKILYQECLDRGVSFEFNQRIEKSEKKENGYDLTTKTGFNIDSKNLIWTLPFYTGLPGGQKTKFISRSIAIYHFSSEEAPGTDRHYIYCQQADMRSYRLTFYDNIKERSALKPYRITVEVIYDEEPPKENIIQRELVLMGLFGSTASTRLEGVTRVPHGFPVPKIKEQKEQEELFKKVAEQNPGVIFVGRGRPGLFFTTDVLSNVYNSILRIA